MKEEKNVIWNWDSELLKPELTKLHPLDQVLIRETKFLLASAFSTVKRLKARNIFFLSPFCSQMLEAVPLLSYDVPMETKRAQKLVTAEWWQTVPDYTITSNAAQDAQKATGFKMLLNVTATLAKQAWNLQLIKDGILGTMSSFSLEEN